MKKEDRLLFIELAKEINASLCTFCSYGDWYADGCCDGYTECKHPVESLSYQSLHERDLEPGDDCYGFRPVISQDIAVEITSAVLTQGYDEWFYRKYSRKSATVYGRTCYKGVESSSKVRIEL